MKETEIKKAVREGYARIARQDSSCCPTGSSCCGGPSSAEQIGKSIGYSDDELKAAPEGANLGLGCGNPVALASLREGETVLDLGSGAGFDCFLAAGRVGPEGRVIGVDMTPEMIHKARENAGKGGYENVEFRLGEIENLPVADRSADVIISNCVINLAPDKRRVFREAWRALKPGGRLMISDMVLLKELPALVRSSVEAYVGCLAGAVMRGEYLKAIADAGFEDVRVAGETVFPVELMVNDPTARAVVDDLNIPEETIVRLADSVASVKVSAVKPARKSRL